MIHRDAGFHALGCDIHGNVIGELRLDTVTVTKNLNAPDEATVGVILDASWGPPAPPDWDPQPGGAAMSHLQPWAACVAVFDNETDAVLFYGPIVKRRRTAHQSGPAWGAGIVELDCQSWEGWLQHVYPELDKVSSGVDGEVTDDAYYAVEKVLWGDYVWDGTEWLTGGVSGTAAERRGSVAGRAGVGFGVMPLQRWTSWVTGYPVYLDWSTTAENRGATSAWQLITEVLEQGVDFQLYATLDSTRSKMTVTPWLEPVPDWDPLPEPAVIVTAGDSVLEGQIGDRGDLFASLVRVTGGQGEIYEYPDVGVDGGPTDDRNRLLVERTRPYQQRGGPVVGSEALEARASLLQRSLFPSPVEVQGMDVKARLPGLRPGTVILFEVPKGADQGAPNDAWEVLGRVQSVTWAADIVGARITMMEPGSDAALGAVSFVPPPASLQGRITDLESIVASLRLR